MQPPHSKRNIRSWNSVWASGEGWTTWPLTRGLVCRSTVTMTSSSSWRVSELSLAPARMHTPLSTKRCMSSWSPKRICSKPWQCLRSLRRRLGKPFLHIPPWHQFSSRCAATLSFLCLSDGSASMRLDQKYHVPKKTFYSKCWGRKRNVPADLHADMLCKRDGRCSLEQGWA